MQLTISSGGTEPITRHVLAEYLDSGAYERHLRGLQLSCEQQVERMHQVTI